MKRMMMTVSALCVAGSMSLMAQSGPGGDGGSGGGGSGSGDGSGSGPGPFEPNFFDYSYSWSNYFQNDSESKNAAKVQAMSKEGAPAKWTSRYQQTFGKPTEQPGAGAQAQNRFDKTQLSTETQAMIRQFQQDRVRLMNQLKTASDEERRQILKEMDQIRAKLKEQTAQLREQAQQQAEQMRQRFANERDRLLDQGAGGGNGGQQGGRDR